MPERPPRVLWITPGTFCAMIDVTLTQNIQMHSVESEALQGWGYDVETRQMVLRFQNGKTFRYTGVPGDVAVQVIASEHPGAAFNRHVRGKFPHTEV